MCLLKDAAGVHIGDQQSLIILDRCAEHCESQPHGTCFFWLLCSHKISHKRRAMTQTCVSCGKEFRNSVSLDRHGARCSEKRGRLTAANPRSQFSQGSSSQAHKRARVKSPDNCYVTVGTFTRRELDWLWSTLLECSCVLS